ncbi:hypothetical protein Q3G72_015019 [Acer saccharum]|nr:hypothetical protein Q3G72_015019 [Acer saccharum]
MPVRKEFRFKEEQSSSYAEVLKEKRQEKGLREGVSNEMPELLISECSLSNPLWLKKSAVGMLKIRSFDEKPTWFNFAGVALDFWNKDFFKKLGSMFGDTVLIDDETLFRKRLNSARLLLLVPPNQTFPKVIKIVDGYRNFYVSVES